MKKATPKKRIKKEVAKTPDIINEEKQNTSTYKLVMVMNNEVFECETTDLKQAILSFAPKQLKTKIFFKIMKDGKVATSVMFLRKGRMLFKKELFLETFIRFLRFK